MRRPDGCAVWAVAVRALQARPGELVEAAKAQDEALVADLLRRGAGPDDANDYGCTALYWAACRCHQGIVASRGWLSIESVRKHAALMEAANNGHAGWCLQLLAGGASVNAKNGSGYTAVKWPKAYNKTKCVRVLEAAGGTE